jgi:hypothetical protein
LKVLRGELNLNHTFCHRDRHSGARLPHVAQIDWSRAQDLHSGFQAALELYALALPQFADLFLHLPAPLHALEVRPYWRDVDAFLAWPPQPVLRVGVGLSTTGLGMSSVRATEPITAGIRSRQLRDADFG